MEFDYPFINNKLNPIRGNYIAPPANLGNIDIVLEKRMREFKEKLAGHINNLKTKYMNKSFGEILIGTTFNPSGQDDVQYVKNEFAKLANLAETVVNNKLKEVALSEASEEELEQAEGNFTFLYESALQQLVLAQMSLVKLLTFKNQ